MTALVSHMGDDDQIAISRIVLLYSGALFEKADDNVRSYEGTFVTVCHLSIPMDSLWSP